MLLWSLSPLRPSLDFLISDPVDGSLTKLWLVQEAREATAAARGCDAAWRGEVNITLSSPMPTNRSNPASSPAGLSLTFSVTHVNVLPYVLECVLSCLCEDSWELLEAVASNLPRFQVWSLRFMIQRKQ